MMCDPPVDFHNATLADFPKLKIPETEMGYFILGPVGTGKTHLAAAVFWHMRIAGADGIFATAVNWIRAFKAEFDGIDIPELQSPTPEYNPAVYIPPPDLATRARSAGLVVIDDYGANYPTEWAREQLLGIVNDRLDRKRFTIVTTNLDWKTLKRTDERFFDRLRFLEVIALTGKSRRGT